jgi:hypothetical protein
MRQLQAAEQIPRWRISDSFASLSSLIFHAQIFTTQITDHNVRIIFAKRKPSASRQTTDTCPCQHSFMSDRKSKSFAVKSSTSPRSSIPMMRQCLSQLSSFKFLFFLSTRDSRLRIFSRAISYLSAPGKNHGHPESKRRESSKQGC